ncbi:MAG TPA: hypothetical protein VGM32_04240 [Rhodopila sp.]|jgi:O-antigen/teichoic acid export membrane protein
MLALLIPPFGLTGAAVAAAAAVVLEQAMTVATELRRFNVSTRAIAGCTWRPALAAAMAVVLAAVGWGWIDDPAQFALSKPLFPAAQFMSLSCS